MFFDVKNCIILVGRKTNATSNTHIVLTEENSQKIPFKKYQIKETDFRTKTATLTSPFYIDLTTGSYAISIISIYHENFYGYILSADYDEDTGLYNYQCQDHSRMHQTVGSSRAVGKNIVYKILQTRLTDCALDINTKLTANLKEYYKTKLKGLKNIELYDQSLYKGNLVKGNPMKDKPKYLIKNKPSMDIIKAVTFGRIRFATRNDQPLVPEYPELIDLKITNKCGNMCKFCFMGSNMDGSHADINHLKYIINQLGDTYDGTFHRVEFSIGGGDVLLYPQLDELFSFMRKNGHIINVTIKASDVMRLLDDDDKIETFRKYVSGIGVSVVDASDVDNIIALKGALTGKDVVAHLIPEYLGFDKTIEIVNRIDTASVYISKLYLGFKQMGRAKDMKYTVFRGDQLDKMFSGCRTVRVDTAFANRYMWYIKDNFSYKNTITLLEGEFSMYIDGVEEKAYKSSYHLDKPYNMRLDYHNPGDHMSIKQAFAAIRKDNGLLTYDELEDHYYDEPEKSN